VGSGGGGKEGDLGAGITKSTTSVESIRSFFLTNGAITGRYLDYV
jgi:hypothetical protein